MYIIKKNKALYAVYFIAVIISYIIGFNIVPLEIVWVLNKIFYFNTFLTCLLLISQSDFSINKGFFRVTCTLILFIFFTWISLTLNNSLSLKLIEGFIAGFSYVLTFILVYKVVCLFSLAEVLRPFLIMSILTILISIAILFGFEPHRYITYDNTSSLQISSLLGFTGPFVNQNSFVVYMFIASSAFLAGFLRLYPDDLQSFLYSKKTSIALLGLSCFLSLTTLSRAGILSIIIVLTLLFIKGYKNKKIFILISLVTFFLILNILYFNEITAAIISRMTNEGTSLRYEIWMDALETLKTKPYFGVGSYYYQHYDTLLSTHNLYLHYMVTTGIVPFIFWVLTFIEPLKLSLYNLLLLKFTEINRIAILFSCIFIAILFHQFFEVIINVTYNTLTLIFFLTTSILLKHKDRKHIT